MAGETLICTNCHGSFRFDGKRRTKVAAGPIFGTPDHMMLHKKWLQGMKQTFLEKQRETIRALRPYQNVGEWIGKAE